jgi:hypothetical protein
MFADAMDQSGKDRRNGKPRTGYGLRNDEPILTRPVISTHDLLPARACVMDARKQFWEWNVTWGEVGLMHSRLKQDYCQAVHSGTVGSWVENANRQLAQGLVVLENLKCVFFSELPRDDGDVGDIWLQVCTLFDDIYRGISIVQAWLVIAQSEQFLFHQ